MGKEDKDRIIQHWCEQLYQTRQSMKKGRRGILNKQKSYPLKTAVSLLLAGTMTLGMVPSVFAAQGQQHPLQALKDGVYNTIAPELRQKEAVDIWTSYNQDLNADINSITGAQTVEVGTVWGLDGKTLNLSSVSGDVRVKLTDFEDKDAGAYELSFRTGKEKLGSIGFLVRYKDEANYTGLSIDSNQNWTLHYSTGLGSRGNDPFDTKGPELKPETAYKIRIEYSGADVTVKYMEEGGTEYVSLGTKTMANGHSVQPGGFAVRLNPGSYPGKDVTIDNVVQYDATNQVVKTLDFNALTQAPGYEARSNKTESVNNANAALTLQELPATEQVPGFDTGKVSKIATAGVYVDSTSPVSNRAIYSVKLNATGPKYGLVFNHKDQDNYATIEYDGAKWVAGGKVAGQPVSIDLSDKNIPAPVANEAHTWSLDYSKETGYSLTMDEDSAHSYDLGTLQGICTEKGNVGVVTGEGTTLYAGAINVKSLAETPDIPDPTTGFITLASNEMQVLVGDSFPHIYTYKSADGQTDLAYGVYPSKEDTGMKVYTTISSNGKLDTNAVVNCTTTSQKVASDANSATYSIVAVGDGVNVTFTVKLVVEGKTLKMEVLNVEEAEGSAVVRAFGFSNAPMVTMYGVGAGAAMSRADGWGPVSDIFVHNKSVTTTQNYDHVTYALLYDEVNKSVAAIENNAEDGANKYLLTQTADAVPALELSNTYWPWQYHDTIDPANEEKPYATVVIGGDENQDSAITWQDAGIAYRDIMHTAYGAENVKNEWMYIAMNMSSQASQPFLRVLDTAKVFSYQTDGFGMKIMNKGYQGAGHDDSHGDYAFVGSQQGGLKEFNYLIDEGLKYGIKNGVHINMTEFSLDSRAATSKNMLGFGSGLRPNWNWFDQAYLVDKHADVANGGLKTRLDAFDKACPNLDFIYVDVYQSGSTYNASQAMKYMNDNGWTVGTEALGDFNQDVSFVHWNTDLYYPVGGSQSQVMRFITNSVGDLGAPDRALLGAMMPGVGDWRNTNIFNDAQTTFYRENLPTKYLQYFDLLEWTPNQHARFANNVESTVSTEGDKTYTTITKDGKTVAKIDTTAVRLFDDYANKGNPARPSSAEIFIPWSPVVEDKIYCYSDNGGTQTWQVPNSWADVKTAYLYTLTNSGRTNMQTVAVENGAVTLNLIADQPYILVKTQAAQPHLYNADGTATNNLIPAPTGENTWGQGSVINNFGFSSATMEGWNKAATKGSENDITVDTTFTGTSSADTTKGDPRVKFDNTVAGSIAQTVKVQPGKTYTFSAWVNSESARPVTLTVTAKNETETVTLDTTAGIPVKMKPSKYTGKDYQRIQLNITIPEGVNTATLTFSTVEGEQPVYVDDFRAWEWPDNEKPNPLTEKYYYYEDFENLDENWGPFASSVNTQPYTNLAYKLEDGSQIKTYTVDTLTKDGKPDADNKVSLKASQSEGFKGTLMRTLPSTVDFKEGAEYLVEIDYQSYREVRGKKNPPVDLAGKPISQQYYGYNYPLAETNYTLNVRHANGDVIESYPFNPSTFKEGTEIDKFSFNSRPSTQLMSVKVDATAEPGIYLTIDVVGNDSANSILSIDNFRVTKISTTNTVTINAGEHMTKTAQSGDATQTVDKEKAIVNVVYTADKGYYFPEDYAVAEKNGIRVERNSDTQITISGTPTADVTLALPAASLLDVPNPPVPTPTATPVPTATPNPNVPDKKLPTQAVGTWEMEKGYTGEVGVRVEADIKSFVRVLWNGNVLSSENYSIEQGSIIVKLKPEFLKTLTAGSYQLKVETLEGYATATIKVTETVTPSTPATPVPQPNAPATSTPQTGDFGFGAMSIAFMVSLAATTLIWNKKKQNND